MTSNRPRSTPRALDDAVLADRLALVRTIVPEVQHVVANTLQSLAIGGVAPSETTQARLGLAMRALTRLCDDDDAVEGPVLVEELLRDVDECRRAQAGLPAVPVTIEIEGALALARGRNADLRHALLALVTRARRAVGEASGAAIRIAAGVDGEAVVIAVEARAAGRTVEANPGASRSEPGPDVARLLIERGRGALATEPLADGVRWTVRIPAWKTSGDASVPGRVATRRS